jgi:hypothetical protein
MEDAGAFCGHLVYFTCSHLVCFMVIWYILWSLGIFYGHMVYIPVLVCCTKKNLATLAAATKRPICASQPIFPN